MLLHLHNNACGACFLMLSKQRMLSRLKSKSITLQAGSLFWTTRASSGAVRGLSPARFYVAGPLAAPHTGSLTIAFFNYKSAKARERSLSYLPRCPYVCKHPPMRDGHAGTFESQAFPARSTQGEGPLPPKPSIFTCTHAHCRACSPAPTNPFLTAAKAPHQSDASRSCRIAMCHSPSALGPAAGPLLRR